jgi:protein SCO1
VTPGRIIATCALCLGMLWCARGALSGTPPPADLGRRVGFDQKLGDEMPHGLAFVDADGKETRLDPHGRPLLLALGYYRCPNLCGATLRGMADAVAGSGLVPGHDFDVAFISIDPRETPESAAAERMKLESAVPRADAAAWEFLTGAEASIRPLAHAVGFRYFYDPRIDQYAHAAGIVVVTAGGRVAQYFFGVHYPPRSLRLALIDASKGRLGSVIDRLVLFCCGYDPSTGHYSVLIGRVMTIVGCAFALALGALVWRLNRGGRKA